MFERFPRNFILTFSYCAYENIFYVNLTRHNSHLKRTYLNCSRVAKIVRGENWVDNNTYRGDRKVMFYSGNLNSCFYFYFFIFFFTPKATYINLSTSVSYLWRPPDTYVRIYFILNLQEFYIESLHIKRSFTCAFRKCSILEKMSLDCNVWSHCSSFIYVCENRGEKR